jgi:hypothetical protein
MVDKTLHKILKNEQKKAHITILKLVAIKWALHMSMLAPPIIYLINCSNHDYCWDTTDNNQTITFKYCDVCFFMLIL